MKQNCKIFNLKNNIFEKLFLLTFFICIMIKSSLIISYLNKILRFEIGFGLYLKKYVFF